MRRFLWILSLAALLPAGSSWAQLPPPNEAGVSLATVFYNVTDRETTKKFWALLGAAPVKLGNIEYMKIPNTLILLRQQAPTGTNDGAVLQHVSYKVANPQELMEKMKAAGYKTEPGGNPRQVYVYSPDDAKIEFLQDTAMTVPIAVHHVHYYVGESGPGGPGGIAEMQAWYAKTLGAKIEPPPSNPSGPVDRLGATIPGANLTFTKSPTPTVSSKDRALDRVAFEVKNLEAFCKKLEASGIKFERPYSKSETTGNGIATFLDPWGTPVEMLEGLNRLF